MYEISKEKVQEREMIYKKVLHKRIDSIISHMSKIKVEMQKISKYVDIDSDTPNIGITLHNKIIELANIFEQSGISMFSEVNEKNGIIGTNIVGEAIITDLINRTVNGVKELDNYNSTIKNVRNKRGKKITSLQKIGPIRRVFFSIRSFFQPKFMSDMLTISQSEIEKSNSYLADYRKVDNELWEYNLDDDLFQSLLTYINENYSASNAIGVVKECIEPTLKKIGYESLIPKLKEQIIKSQEAEENKNSWSLSDGERVNIGLKFENNEAKSGNERESYELDK